MSVTSVKKNDHFLLLKQGTEGWNRWRTQNPLVAPNLYRANFNKASFSHANLSLANLNGANLNGADLSEADLSGVYLEGAKLSSANLSNVSLTGANLRGANLAGANLTGANLNGANLCQTNLNGTNLDRICDLTAADLSRVDLRRRNFCCWRLINVNLSYADLGQADLSGATLTDAILTGANLAEANLRSAQLNGAILTGANLYRAALHSANLSQTDLSGANLEEAYFLDTNLENAVISDCPIYGISAWNLNLNGAQQKNLIITKYPDTGIRVDNLEAAQFIFLLLNNKNIRGVIDTIGKKAVLILGRFKPDRKVVLDSIRERLRFYGYLPILFDFERPTDRDVTETISTLAHMSRFIIADLTEPSSIPKELESIVPTLAVPVQPLLEGTRRTYSMFKDYWKYDWVLQPHRYTNRDALLASLEQEVIGPAEKKAEELSKRRTIAMDR